MNDKDIEWQNGALSERIATVSGSPLSSVEINARYRHVAIEYFSFCKTFVKHRTE